jgi:hypothetical protein
MANHDPTLTTMSSKTLGGEGERMTRTRFQGQTTLPLARSSQLSSIVTTTAQRQCTAVHQPRLGRPDQLNGLREIWTRLGIHFVACPKNEEGRTGAGAQTDANETDRHEQDRQTQTQQTERNQNKQRKTEVRQDDNVRSRRTSKDTDETTTEQQGSHWQSLKTN